MSQLSDLFLKGKALPNDYTLFPTLKNNPPLKSYAFPNDTGSYNAGQNMSMAPVPEQNMSMAPGATFKPVVPPAIVQPPVKTKTGGTGGGSTFTGAPTAGNYDKYKDPATGKILTPQEYADMLAKRVSGGDISTYAGNALSNQNQSIEDMNRDATGMNNARNDIATGTTDPYNIASRSGIQYTPQELKAIESAYAGIYDPALTDVFTKIDQKQKEAADALQQKNELEKMALQHKYSMTEKQAPSYSDLHPAGGTSGFYVKGANPTVDAYADAILSGKTDLQNIPTEYRGAVAQAVAGQDVKTEQSPYLKSIALQGRQAVGGLLGIAEKNPDIFGKSAAAPWPNMIRSDDFRNYTAQLDYLKGNIIPAALTAMREASKTGGALGQVSDREGAWLASSLGALDMIQSSDMAIKQLKLIDESMARWQEAVDANTSGGSSQPQTMILNGQTLTLQADGTYE